MKVVDLFSGAGGLSQGFQDAGFTIIRGVDSDERNVEAFNANFPGVGLNLDLAQLGDEESCRTILGDASSVDVVVAGPPCQGFSMGGHRRATDPRNKLLVSAAEVAAAMDPRHIVIENVEGILTRRMASTVAAFRAVLRHRGFRVVGPITLDSSHFGVPQRRRRVFFVASRHDARTPSFQNLPVRPTPTVRDAIGDLADIDLHLGQLVGDIYDGPLGLASDYALRLRQMTPGPLSGCRRTAHSDAVVNRFKSTPEGSREPVSRFFRLSWTGQAPTLRAGSDRHHGSFTAPRPIHPDRDRCISVREAARLQGFPDRFTFDGTIWHGFRQVGNAVPPPLAMVVARRIADA